MSNTYQTALQWHSLGVSCIPILAGSKLPALDSWKPYQTRLPTLRELRIWFQNTKYNIAAITSWTDLVVIDWDDAWLYSQWLTSLDGAFPMVAQTYKVKTRRGWHLYFRCQNAQSWKGVGVDVKAAGGYVLVPPSSHPSGYRYAGIGSIEAIKRIPAITDLLPEYETDRLQSRRLDVVSGNIDHDHVDPFDAAMRDCCGGLGISVADIKARVSWADILPGVGNVGKRMIKILCPLHKETQPSFVIYPDGRAKCYGCGFWGDLLDCWAAMHNLTVREAMADLAEKFL